MITHMSVRAVENGFVVDVDRVVSNEAGDKVWENETFVFEKVSKLNKALKLFASDLGVENDPPF